MILVTKEYTAEIAHRLPRHSGNCKYIHGHSYRFEITLEGEVNETGMVIDFKEAKTLIEKVIGDWDHSLILYEGDPLTRYVDGYARIIKFPWYPTAENMACYIGRELTQKLASSFAVSVHSVRVWETATSVAEWRR